MFPLWQQGDSLAQALAALHAIAEDLSVGRAERVDVIAVFEGLDRHTSRLVWGELIGWQQQVLFTVSRIELPGAMQDAARIGLAGAPQDADLLTTPGMRWAFRRWVQGSPLRRAALAGLADMQGFGVELDDVDLAGRWLPIPRRRGGHRSEPPGGSTGSGRDTGASRTASPARTAGWTWSSPPARAR